MEPRTTVGIALTILSGTLEGSMAFPMQFASRWRWEKYLAGLFDFWNASDTLGRWRPSHWQTLF